VEQLNRRTFLKRAGITAAAAGAVAAVPGGIGAAGATTEGHTSAAHSTEAPLTSDEVSKAEPLVAHVRNAGTGEIALFVGDREVTIRDRHVAARLVRATR
jgi:hypothetical protein